MTFDRKLFAIALIGTFAGALLLVNVIDASDPLAPAYVVAGACAGVTFAVGAALQRKPPPPLLTPAEAAALHRWTVLLTGNSGDADPSAALAERAAARVREYAAQHGALLAPDADAPF